MRPAGFFAHQRAAMTDRTANFLVNRRMNESQQMWWSRRGADLLHQVRYDL
jgi:hypothetical protein